MKSSPFAVIVFSFFLVQSLVQSQYTMAQETVSHSGIALDSPWKQAVYQFAKEELRHSAWGLEHYERNYTPKQ